MIDLVSTSTADAQTARCARLLAAVISNAIMDAGQSFTHHERKQRRMQTTARHAIQWIFTPGTAFEAYANLIGLNPSHIREALLGNAPLKPGDKALWSEQSRRNLQIRYRLFLAGDKNEKAN